MTFDELRRQANLIDIAGRYLELRREGREHVARCPWHKDQDPSLHLYQQRDDVQRYKCFGCEARGDVIDFVRHIEHLPDIPTAARRLEELIGMPHENGSHPPAATKRRLKFIESYPYVDERGKLLFEVRRFVDEDTGRKTFSQRRPDGDGWVNTISGVRRVLYRLPRILAAREQEVWIVEGEKDVHTLERLGLLATTNAGGAKQPWLPEYTEALRGRRVILVPDNDSPGRERVERIAAAIGDAAAVDILELPELARDVTDYIESGQTLTDLLALPRRAPEPPPAAAPAAAVAEPVAENWRAHLIPNREGNPRAVLANAITALRLAPEWQGVLGWNEFTLSAYARRPTPWGAGSSGDHRWGDAEDILAAEWLQHQGILVGKEIVTQAVIVVAQERRYHPVREYLEMCQWDGDRRIDTWLSDHLGVEPGNYSAAVGVRWLISAVARIHQPGCKADCCLILEGEQGTQKSTALRMLTEPWFTDEIADLGSKDAALQTSGVWLIELAELDSMTRGEVGRIKAFMSRAVDRFRPPYGRHTLEAPRQCVFAGSVNHQQYLRDETGGRRFWPVVCGQIDPDGIRRDRDQLWAEARARYLEGSTWWLDTPELIAEAEQHQALRYEGDPWDEKISDWLGLRDRVTVAQVLEMCLQKPLAQWTQVDKNRVGRTLRSLGWKRFYARTDSGGREWQFHRL